MSALANPKSQIFKSQLLFTSKFLGFKSLWRMPAEWTYFRPLKIWYKKNWMWSSDNGWLDLIIYARSVSISSLNTYISLNSLRDLGFNIVLMVMTLSCCSSLMIFNSLSVLYANTLCSNAFSIFLMATKLFSWSSASRSLAATTTP